MNSEVHQPPISSTPPVTPPHPEPGVSADLDASNRNELLKLIRDVCFQEVPDLVRATLQGMFQPAVSETVKTADNLLKPNSTQAAVVNVPSASSTETDSSPSDSVFCHVCKIYMSPLELTAHIDGQKHVTNLATYGK